MKKIVILLTLLTISFSGHAESTPYGYNIFCESGANEMLKKLNEANKAENDKLEELRKEVDSLKAKSVILNDLTTLKNDYLKSLKILNDQKQAKSAIETIDNVRTIIKNGLTISAIGMLMKNQNLNDPKAFTLASLCSREENATTQLCLKENQQKNFLSFLLKNKQDLDQSLNGFKEAYFHVTDNKSIDRDIDKILSSIPRKLSPDAIISFIRTKSPNIFGLIGGDISPEDILLCLDTEKNISDKNVYTACGRLLKGPGNREKIAKAISAESDELKKEINKDLSPVISSASLKTMKDLTANLEKLDQYGKNRETLMADTYNKLQDLAGKVTATTGKNGLAVVMGVSEEDGQKIELDLQTNCSSNLDSRKCEASLKLALERINYYDQNVIDQMNKNQDAVKTILSNDDFIKNENLKKYVGEKFLRTCQTRHPGLKTQISPIELDKNGCFAKQGLELTQIVGLHGDINNISSTLFTQSLNGTKYGEYTFLKPEIEQYRSLCNSSATFEKFREVCEDIRSEVYATNKKVTSEKKPENWDKINKDNWVEYDPMSPNGYKLIKKKSKTQIFAEGVLPVVPSFLPTYFANQQMNYQIDYLTDAAIYQKQQLHYYDFWNTQFLNYSYGGAPFNSTYSTGYNFGI